MIFSNLKRVISKQYTLYLVLCTSYFFTSCDPNRVFEENKDIPKYIWISGDKKEFSIPISDTVSPHNIFINVRNSDDYKFSNIYLFITTTFPDGKISKDTLECILADDRGHWLGDGLGDIWDNQIPFKKNVRFPSKGNYTIALEQAMRPDEIREIMDVGVRVEKQSK